MQKISDAEMKVMRIIWEHKNPMSSAEIISFLYDSEWKLTTVLTLLSRLTDKGFLKSEKKGRINIYTSIISKNEYKKMHSKNFLNEFYQGSIKSFFATLYSGGEISDNDLNELRALFDKKEDDK